MIVPFWSASMRSSAARRIEPTLSLIPVVASSACVCVNAHHKSEKERKGDGESVQVSGSEREVKEGAEGREG